MSKKTISALELIMTIVILLLILAACQENKQKPIEVSYVIDNYIDNSSDCSIALPTSGNDGVFGNRLNNNNIVYYAAERCYYLSMPYYIDDFEGSSNSILAYGNRLGEDLSTFDKLSDNRFEQLQISDGNLYYITDGKLISKHGEEFAVVLDDEISDYCVDGGCIYFKIAGHPEVWLKTVGSDAPPLKLPIDNIVGFQASGGMFFYHDGVSVYMYDNGLSTAICTVTGDGELGAISDFIVDGILLYSTVSGDLFLAGGEKIAEGVICYTLSDSKVYYSTLEEGLFIYDLFQKRVDHIIAFDKSEYRVFAPGIVKINIQNNRLFLSVINGRFSGSCIFTSDVDGSGFKPLISTDTREFNTFTYSEQGFIIDYPLGYTVHFDPGSYYSGCLLMADIMHDIFVCAYNTRSRLDGSDEYAEAPEESTSLENAVIVDTTQGYHGLYRKNVRNGRFGYTFVLDEFTINMEGPEEYRDIAEPIFLEMAKSLTVICGN